MHHRVRRLFLFVAKLPISADSSASIFRINFEEIFMKNKIITTGFLGLTVFAAMPVSATEQIAYSLFGDPGYITSCNVCHTNANINTADNGNLMFAAKSAYKQDKWGLSGLKTFVAAATAPVVPTCSSTQVLNTAKNVCENKPAPVVPTCSSTQVLNTAKNVCENKPAPVVPTCSSTQVLNTAKNVCENKPAPVVVPTCKSTEVLNATKTACVTKPASVVTPTVTPVSKVNTKPVLNSVNAEWNIEVGQQLIIPLSVKDAEQNEFELKGTTTGSKFGSVYTDAKSLLPTIDFQWTPTITQQNKIYTISFQAKETKTAEKYASNKVSVRIRVWAAGNRDAASVSKFNVATSAWSANKLTLTGNVVFNNLLTPAERQAFIAKKFDLTVTSDSTGKGALIATTPLTLDSKGNWSVSFPLAQTQVPCNITVQYEGQNAARTVAGCSKSVAMLAEPLTVASREDEHDKIGEHEDDEHEHGEHDD